MYNTNIYDNVFNVKIRVKVPQLQRCKAATSNPFEAPPYPFLPCILFSVSLFICVLLLFVYSYLLCVISPIWII